MLPESLDWSYALHEKRSVRYSSDIEFIAKTKLCFIRLKSELNLKLSDKFQSSYVSLMGFLSAGWKLMLAFQTYILY
jgi:hypothetical protein